MAGDDTLIQVAQDVGELKGTMRQALTVLGELKQATGPLPAMLADHERRIRDLEEQRSVTRSWWQHVLGPIASLIVGAGGVLVGRLWP
jgi:hypothetical protein